MTQTKEELLERFNEAYRDEIIRLAESDLGTDSVMDFIFDFFWKEIEEAQRLHQIYFDKFNETFEIATKRTNEVEYWKKGCDKWLQMHNNHAHIIDQLNAKISRLESTLEAAEKVIERSSYDWNKGHSGVYLEYLEKYQQLKTKSQS